MELGDFTIAPIEPRIHSTTVVSAPSFIEFIVNFFFHQTKTAVDYIDPFNPQGSREPNNLQVGTVRKCIVFNIVNSLREEGTNYRLATVECRFSDTLQGRR